ncbi:hypothetical protein [Mycobacteroides abscessus]|uniref:hypothetical protein n=1 Tax=Mycobacteroides abscessus TaxID=36809 RepID=UPI0027B8A9B9|nr:hypothetical protein [Mycobacteroides abscessus]
MLARTDYPEGNGKFLVQDKAAIQKDDAKRPDPVVTPAICADVVNEDKKNDKLDEARTKYSTETLDADSTVALGTDGSFAKAEEGAKKCPAVTFEMSGITVNATVTFADVPGAAVEATARRRDIRCADHRLGVHQRRGRRGENRRLARPAQRRPGKSAPTARRLSGRCRHLRGAQAARRRWPQREPG